MAVSCVVRPIGTVGFAGVIVIELSVAVSTVTASVVVVDPTVTVMVATPRAMPWSTPFESTVATEDEEVL